MQILRFWHLSAALLLGLAGAVETPAQTSDPAAQTRLISLGKCLTRPVDATDGTQLVLAACADLPTQAWHLPLRGHEGPIRSEDGRCVDVRGALAADFTPIILFPCHGRANQQWLHTLDGRLKGLGGKCLDVQAASDTDGTPTILFRCNGQANQRWREESTGGWNASHLQAGGKASHLATAPTAPRMAYASTGTSGLFRSEDNGATWAPASRGLPANVPVTFVAVDPEHESTVLIVAGGQILRSHDAGATFSPMYRERPIHSVYWRPGTDEVFGLAAGAELMVSGDRGLTWTRRAFIADSRLEFTDLLIGPGENPTLWAAAPNCAFFCGGGLWRSDDGGENWVQELAGEVGRVVLDATRQRLYALDDTLLRRRELPAGVWQVVASMPHRLTDLWIDANTGTLVAATLGALWRDDGTGWQGIDAGLATDDQGDALEWVSRFALGEGGPSAGQDPLTLLAAVDSAALAESRRILRSTDLGLTWQAAGEFAWTAGKFPALELAPDGGVLAAGDAGVFRSADGGSSWTSLKGQEPGLSYSGVIAAPAHPSHLYVTGSRNGPGPFLWRSLDSGASWTAVATNTNTTGGVETEGFIDSSVAGQTVLLTTVVGRFASTQVAGVLRSADLGASWKAVGLGGRVAQLAKGPMAGELFAGGEAGVHRSVDGGDSWQREIEAPIEALTAVGDQVYALGAGVFRRRDAGEWQAWPAPTALGRAKVLRAIAARPGLLYLGTESQGVFRSIDHGSSWQALNPGLPARAVLALEPTPQDPERLWASVRGQGLFRGRFGAVTPPSLDQGRFLVDVRWRDFVGATGRGTPAVLTRDTGAFWFFDPENLELAVKILDGRALNGHFWIFFASLTNVEFDLEVVDLWTGERRTYHNPSGTLASFGDTSALPSPQTVPASAASASAAPASASSGAADTTVLQLGDRFDVEISWVDPQGQGGQGLARAVTAETGYFYFFTPDNVEVLVKVLDGRPINGHFWVFFGGLSNVEYTVTVKDRVTQNVQIYHNPQGQFASLADIAAF